jgi:2-methylisocitrate lyase-like PEP mutase family enzyme
VIYGFGAGGGLAVIPDDGPVHDVRNVRKVGQIVASARTAGPVIPDADIGYGNGINLVWTIRDTTDTQFAELHIEDQGFPAKSGHLDWRASLSFDSLEATARNLS